MSACSTFDWCLGDHDGNTHWGDVVHGEIFDASVGMWTGEGEPRPTRVHMDYLPHYFYSESDEELDADIDLAIAELTFLEVPVDYLFRHRD